VHTDTTVEWTAARWLNEPPAWQLDGPDLLVAAAEGSDFWRTTSYGFVHDSGHALLTDLPVGAAVEVAFVAELPEQFDQAGVLVRAGEDTWIKAGLERSDGELQLGAVVTRGPSDWSLSPAPSWAGAVVTVRASRGPDAVTLRARCGGGPWQLVRLAPLSAAGPVGAGPLVSAPSRAGLTVRFTGFRRGPADASLHPSE
jgi:hypothetical protein